MGDTGHRLLAVADELICSADLAGYLTDVNPAFSRVLKWAEPEFKSRPYLELIHEDDREPTRAAIKHLHETRRLVDFRNRWRTKDGHFVWIEWRAYLHEGEIYAIGRLRPAGADDNDLEAVVTRVVRAQAADEEERRRAWVEKRDEERAFLEGELKDSETRANVQQTRAKTLQVWVGAFLAIATTIGGGAAWAMKRIEENALRAKEIEDQRKAVDKELSTVNEQTRTNEAKIQRLGEVAVETQVQVSDSTKYIGDKIDAAHPRTADKVDVPEIVKRAAEKVDAIKRGRDVAELFQERADPADPFADLDNDPEDGDDSGP